uniref:DUF4939 domain-containing protein n=1 Tax=Paramormyrops kingsleyae TaxID=1676925 RepID=A0A3B3RW46_9TELE
MFYSRTEQSTCLPSALPSRICLSYLYLYLTCLPSLLSVLVIPDPPVPTSSAFLLVAPLRVLCLCFSVGQLYLVPTIAHVYRLRFSPADSKFRLPFPSPEHRLGIPCPAPPVSVGDRHSVAAVLLINRSFPCISGSLSVCSPLCLTEYFAVQMDPAGNLETRVTAMERLLASHASQVPLPESPPRPTARLPIALPEKYDGNPDNCKGFLMQCGLYVEEHPDEFRNPGAEVRFILSLLTGRAREWATALWADDSPLLNSGREFHRALMEIFNHPAVGRRPGSRLLDCRQGSRSVADFSLEFRTVAANLRWPDDCLQIIFLRALNPDLQDELAHKGEAPCFDDLVQQAVRIDNVVRDRRRRRSRMEPPRQLALLAIKSPEPMQMGRAPLTPNERRRRIQEGLCLYCGEAGHTIPSCHNRPGRETSLLPVGVSSVPPRPTSMLTVPVSLEWGGQRQLVRALVDSGAAGNFINVQLVRRMNIPLQPLAQPLTIQGVTGERMADGVIHYRTVPLEMRVGALHLESLEVLVLPKTRDLLILGLPWLRQHNPHVDWVTGEILAWSRKCTNKCLSIPCKATTVESPNPSDQEVIPLKYREFADVFSKERAFNLPPHRECDCAVNLREGALLPRGRLYPLSVQEEESLETYINEGLRQGIIRL